jgi:hypothetical protein
MSGRSYLLTDTVTARGTAPSIGWTLDPSQWIDVNGAADATFIIECFDLSPPTGGGTVVLNIESSPFFDESTFALAAPPLTLAASSTPVYLKSVASVSTAGLARSVRARITPTGSGAWSATIRIRCVTNRTSYFVPTQLTGCMLWLRADLGVTLSSGFVSTWADQSGNGNNASQGASANRPGFSQTAMNNLPAIQGNGNATTPFFMTTSAFTLGNAATIAVVAQPANPEVAFARLVEHKFSLTYYLGLNGTPNAYKFIVNNGTFPYGIAEGGSITPYGANAIITGMFTPGGGATGTGGLYMNGSPVGSDTFNNPASNNLPLYIMQDVTAPSQPWNGYLGEIVIYNRALSSGEFLRLHRYLGGRYGVTVP